MNLPEITASIGAMVQKESSALASIIKKPKKWKESEDPFLVFMVFDLLQEKIIFENPLPYNEEMLIRFNYFGNNSAAASQYYLTREVTSLKYLLSSTWSDLYSALEKSDLGESELATILKKMEKSGLITIAKKKGEGKVDLKKLEFIIEQGIQEKVVLEKNDIKIAEEKIKFEDLIKKSLHSESKSDKIILVVPVLRDGDNDLILSQHEDYIKLVKINNKLGSDETSGDEKQTNKKQSICYICHKSGEDVSYEYSTNFSCSGINKIFTTTTINSARNICKKGYQNNYATCNSCYQKLLAGENYINKNLIGKIARENTFILPEGILEPIEYRNIDDIKKDIDFAFQSKRAEDWLESVESETRFIDALYSLNFVIYKTNGTYVTVLQVIEDVPNIYFKQVIKVMAEEAKTLQDHLKGMSLDTIYRLIPVKINKKKEQLDVARVLSFYKAIFNKEKISAQLIYSYAAEALEKGIRQLRKDKIDNYENLDLYSYLGKIDFFIKKIVMGYIALFRVCQRLNLLDKQALFYLQEGGINLAEENKSSNYTLDDSLNKMEQFLDTQGFTKEARALFYLGTLLNRVALAQYKKGHKEKPILKKVGFQGMTIKDILRLYEDVVEKLRQYDKLTLFSEKLMNRFHENFGNLEKTWLYSDQANVFYLMAGYSYMVGNLSKEDEANTTD